AVAVAVALADKLDTLVGFWAIGEKPTGSGDPYQLRRAALGMIRIVLENDLRVRLVSTCEATKEILLASEARKLKDIPKASLKSALIEAISMDEDMRGRIIGVLLKPKSERAFSPANEYVEHFKLKVANDLLTFFADRLKVHLREKGARHDLID